MDIIIFIAMVIGSFVLLIFWGKNYDNRREAERYVADLESQVTALKVSLNKKSDEIIKIKNDSIRSQMNERDIRIKQNISSVFLIDLFPQLYSEIMKSLIAAGRKEICEYLPSIKIDSWDGDDDACYIYVKSINFASSMRLPATGDEEHGVEQGELEVKLDKGKAVIQTLTKDSYARIFIIELYDRPEVAAVVKEYFEAI